MSELSPEAKRLMEIAREDYTPPGQRTAAVRSALRARLDTARDESELLDRLGGASASSGKAGHWLGLGLLAAMFATGAFWFGNHERGSERGSERDQQQASSVTASAAPAQARPQANDDAIAQPPSAAEMRADLPAQPHAPSAVALAAARSGAAPASGARPAHSEIEHAIKPRASGARSHAAFSAAQSPQPSAAEAPSLSNDMASAAADSSHSRNAVPAAARNPTDAHDIAPAPEAPAAVPPASAKTPNVDDSLNRELALLRRANTALGQNNALAALAAAREHELQFPNGRLRQERMAVRALALCSLGKIREARAASDELERMAPRSPHLARIHASCLAHAELPSQPK